MTLSSQPLPLSPDFTVFSQRSFLYSFSGISNSLDLYAGVH